MKRLITMLALASFTLGAFANEDEVNGNGKNSWNFQNNPYRMDADFQASFDKLPLTGNITSEGKAWPGYYWANNKGGIAQRWRAKQPQNFNYESPERNAIYSLSSDEINVLSPAEKYDLYVGDYTYPTVTKVFSQTSKRAKSWHGICHGVAPSSLHHAEPQTVNLINKDGINITFYASDVKALLAYYYAKVHDAASVQIGSRCYAGPKTPFFRSNRACNDVNAGAFHMILSNMIGLKNTGFVTDMDRYKQVWNHATNSFTSKVLRSGSVIASSAKSAVKRYKVRTKVVYSASIDPQDTAVLMTNLAKYDTRTYVYWVEVNSKNEIVGGSWESKDRPDFLWMKPKATFTGKWSALNDIYSATF